MVAYVRDVEIMVGAECPDGEMEDVPVRGATIMEACENARAAYGEGVRVFPLELLSYTYGTDEVAGLDPVRLALEDLAEQVA